MKYGSSQDARGSLGILLKVKTRTAGSLSPLESLDKAPQYFVECQLQMFCTDAQFCVLQPYHPGTKIILFVKRNNILKTVIKQFIECMFDRLHKTLPPRA